MRRGWITLMALSGLLVAATGYADAPSIEEMQSIQRHMNLTDTLSNTELADYTPEQTGDSLRWTFGNYEGINLSGAGYIDIMPATDNQTSLVVEGDPNTALQGTVSSKALALKLTPSRGGKMTLYIPAQTRYFMTRGFKKVNIYQQPQLLYLSAQDVGQLNVDTKQWMLEYLLLNHVGRADLNDIATPYLLVRADEVGSATLQGNMGLRELDANNDGSITLGWVQSPLLTFHATGKSHVILAGKADVVNAAAADSAVADLKYLDTQRLFVKTTENAKTEVASTRTLNALASNQSTIYYYHKPAVLSRFYQEKGTILYMGEQVPPCTLSQCLRTPVLPG